jgi:VCBS repeat-containing protein
LFRFYFAACATAAGLGTCLALEPPVRILPLGDSITMGQAEPGAAGGYRDRLYQLLTTAGYNVDFIGTFSDFINPELPDKNHQGAPGKRTDEIIAEIPAWLNNLEDPDVVLLLIGTNDFLQTWRNEQPSGVLAELNTLITDIATRRPFAKIIVSTLIPNSSADSSIEAKQLVFNQGIPALVAQHVAQGSHVSWVDMHQAVAATDLYDNVHPTTAGYEKMADAWLPAIQSVIGPKGTGNPPLIAHTDAPEDPTHLAVTFSKPVADDAVDLQNFSISGGLSIINASLDSATKRTVTLTTSPQTPGAAYTLTVSGVRDRTDQQNAIAPQSKAMFFPNIITNSSFEYYFYAWSHSGNVEIENSLFETQYTATEGTHIAVFNSGDRDPTGIVSQSFATTPGKTYFLSFDLGSISWRNSWSQSVEVKTVGSQTLLQTTSTISGNGGGGALKWFPWAYQFTADSATTTLSFKDTSSTSGSYNLDMLLDNVRVTAAKSTDLAVTSTPNSGVGVTISPNDLSGGGNGTTGLIRSYNLNTPVTVTAPASSAGRNFLKWRINGADLPGSNPVLAVTLKANTTLTAVYDPDFVNEPPVAVADSYAAAEDTPLSVPAPGVLGNDTDANSPPLTAVPSTGPSHGSLTLSPDGGFVYTPAANFNGTDSFTYRANDGELDSGTVTVTIHVSAVNDPPLANAQSVSTNEDTQLPVTLTGGDADGDSLNFAVIDGPSNGILTGTAPNLIYIPDHDIFGDDTFTFTVSDGTAPPVPAVITIHVDAVNDPPLANAQSVSTNEDTPLPITLTGGDVDDNDLAFLVIDGPSNGTLGGTAPNLTYTPRRDYHGPDSLTFTVSDGKSAPVAAVVSITVNEIGGTPFAEWLASRQLVAGPAEDSDGDSIGNAIEYVIGGDPLDAMDAAFLPSATVTSENPPQLRFTYRRTARAENDARTDIQVEWSASPAGPWTAADGTHGETTQVEENAAGPETDLVHVFIPASVEGALFARLKVTIAEQP